MNEGPSAPQCGGLGQVRVKRIRTDDMVDLGRLGSTGGKVDCCCRSGGVRLVVDSAQAVSVVGELKKIRMRKWTVDG